MKKLMNRLILKEGREYRERRNLKRMSLIKICVGCEKKKSKGF